MNFDHKLGIRITEARYKINRMPEEVARMLDVPLARYIAWENGVRPIKVNELVLLAMVLETTPNELLDWEG